MTSLISSATMSLDGFIARPDHSPGPLFDWYDAGEVEVSTASPDITFRLTPESAAYWQGWTNRIGALLVGRTLFDVTDGWKARHPLGVPVVVLTHAAPTDWSYPGSDAYRFVTTGLADAVAAAREIAGAKDVAVAAGTVASQCLAAGLLDQVAIDLAPVVLGAGVPYFTGVETEAVLGEPTTVLAAERVTHLVFPCRSDTVRP